MGAAGAPSAGVLGGGPGAWPGLAGDPRTPARAPMIRGAPSAPGGARARAGAGVTPAGRVRYDLYFTALGGKPPSTAAFAASYSGDEFAVAAAPILPLTVTARDPAAQPYRDGAALLYVARFGARDAIAAALSP